jgi:hypothetical protein
MCIDPSKDGGHRQHDYTRTSRSAKKDVFESQEHDVCHLRYRACLTSLKQTIQRQLIKGSQPNSAAYIGEWLVEGRLSEKHLHQVRRARSI